MSQRTLVTVFLRGGADALALVPPVGDDRYHRLRPATAVTTNAGVRLDGHFALHPDLAPLRSLWDAGVMTIVPAAGTPDQTRSHFYAQDWLEQGGEATGGWLARWLADHPSGDAAMAAVALAGALPLALNGARSAVPLSHLSELAWPGDTHLPTAMAALCAGDRLLEHPANDALTVGRRLADLAMPSKNTYPDSGLARQLAQVASLIRADLGMQVACVDYPGWDTHIVQEQGITGNRKELAEALSAFTADLGPTLKDVSIVVFSEFGRRVEENASAGTDHGRASVAFVIGGGTPGGIAPGWTGLSELEDPGDLRVGNDLRDVFLGVLARHGGADAHAVFPGHAPSPVAC